MKIKILVVSLLVGLFSKAIGQQERTVFTQEQLMWFVKNYHPIALQSHLLLNKGESTVRAAKGNFDPYIFASVDQKQYDGENYFSVLNGGLKIPTWYGIEVKSGVDQNGGTYLNPADKTPTNGLVYAGISMPLAQGLLLDKRRAFLKQARIYQESNAAEQNKIINDLYFNAIKSYWKWVQAWNQHRVFKESVQLAQSRFDAVKQSFQLGDKPAIDTLEAFIAVQNRQMNLNQMQILFKNSSLDLSNFLWHKNLVPLDITDSLRPPSITEIRLDNPLPADTLFSLLEGLGDSHPDLQLYTYKIAHMNMERRMKAEGLKPKINVNYNFLTENVGGESYSNLSTENYKWGVDFSFPLFLREERGQLELEKLKIQDTELSKDQKLLELRNKVNSYHNEQEVLKKQVELYESAVQNYRAMLSGEKRKFNNGESSLFMVNSRESSLIKAELKLIEIITKYNLSSTGMLWAAGVLHAK